MSILNSAYETAKAWGESAKNAATTAGNAVANAATTAGNAAANAATTAGRAAANTASAAGHAVANAATTAGNAVADAATATGRAAVNTATAAGNAAANAATTAGNAVVDAAKATGSAIATASEAASNAAVESATAVTEDLIATAKFADNLAAATLAIGVTTLAKNLPWAEQCLDAALAPKGKQPDDGYYMGQDCPKSSETPPVSGTKPKGCAASGKAFPKIIYTNGINTTAAAACATMHKIADTRCAEVVGIYNATDGIGGDVANANRKINGDLSDPAARSLSSLVRGMAARGEQINIYAHSEGGLNAQTGLRIAEARMAQERGQEYADSVMRGINVNSFGTAKLGWPPGPTYRQFTNFSDPVPHLIGAAQLSTYGQTFRRAPNTSRNLFVKPHWNPIDSHSMDNTYLDYLNSRFPVHKNANGSCC